MTEGNERTTYVTYTNWRGETAQRSIIPRKLWFGKTEWHPKEQWLLTAFDIEKQAERDFACQDIREWHIAPPKSANPQ